MKKKPLILMSLAAMGLSACGGQPTVSSGESSGQASTSQSTPISSEPSSESSASSSTPTSQSSSATSEGEKTKYAIRHGSWSVGDEEATSTAPNSILLNTKAEFNEGTMVANVTQNGFHDDGVIFGVTLSSPSASFWEGAGIGYYFMFISQGGTAYLGKTDGGVWTELGNKALAGYSYRSTYEIKVSLEREDDHNSINIFVNGDFCFHYDDYSPLSGKMFGLRAGGAGAKVSYPTLSSEPTHPTAEKVDGKYIGSGAFASPVPGMLVSTKPNSIAYWEDEFELGSFEVDMTQSGIAGDNGIIFSLSRNSNPMFWESGVTYYFFFINFNGFPLLAAANNGTWVPLADGAYLEGYSFASGVTNTLKVVRTESAIHCFVDGNLVISYANNFPLFGSEFGVRSGSAGIQFTNAKFNETGKFEIVEPDNIDVKSGGYQLVNESVYMATKGNSKGLFNDRAAGEDKTISLTFTQGTDNEAGVVFNSNDDMTSYYYFYLANKYAYLAKIENGVTKMLRGPFYLVAGYTGGRSDEVRISVKGNAIACYHRDHCYAYYEDPEMLSGTRFGFMSLAPGASYSNVVVKEGGAAQKNKTLIIGHSYMDFWIPTYKTDLSRCEDIFDIGIGGSIASHWYDLRDEVVSYAPETIIYNIGINDITGTITPSQVIANVSNLLSYVARKLPGVKVCLVGPNHCTARTNIKDKIIELDSKMEAYVQDNSSWMVYAKMIGEFLDGSGNPVASAFTDGLHPTAASYKVFAEKIYNALGI